MKKSFFNEWQVVFAGLFFIGYTLWWSILQLTHQVDNVVFDYFASTYCIIALWGSLWGFVSAGKWGGWKSVMGRAIIFFSLGLFAQAFGQITYSYYVMIQGIEIPYPSIGDLGFFGSIPLYVIATIHLAKASGIDLSLKTAMNKFQAIVIPLIILLVSYALFLKDYTIDRNNLLTTILDFGYPLGQSVYLALAFLTFILSQTLLGGRMKKRVIFILIALAIQYLADFIFLYQASKDSYLAGGINDYIYFVGYYTMALALLQLNHIINELRGSLAT